LYDQPFLIPLGQKIFNPEENYYSEALFSKRNGLYKWHPITLLGTVGLLWMAYRKRVFCWILPPLVLQFLFIGSLADWSGSYAFGQRRWVSGLPFFAMGLASLFSIRWKPWRWVLRAGVVYLIAWNFLVFRVWHGGFFEGGRHSTSKVFWMIQNTPELLFGNLFELAWFPHLILNFSPRRFSLFLLGWVLTLLVAALIIRFLTQPIGRTRMTWVAILTLVPPMGLGAAFIFSDHRSVETLHADLGLDVVYPTHPVPLLSVQKGRGEVFAGEVGFSTREGCLN
jgi:hypothetical protein